MRWSPHNVGATLAVARLRRGGAYCAAVVVFYIPQYGANNNHSLNVFDDPYILEIYDENHSSEEERIKGLGLVKGRGGVL